MATDDELRDLGERIARLNMRELARVLDLACDVEDRWRNEERARQRAAEATFLELERQQKAAAVPPEAAREAG